MLRDHVICKIISNPNPESKKKTSPRIQFKILQKYTTIFAVGVEQSNMITLVE